MFYNIKDELRNENQLIAGKPDQNPGNIYANATIQGDGVSAGGLTTDVIEIDHQNEQPTGTDQIMHIKIPSALKEVVQKACA